MRECLVRAEYKPITDPIASQLGGRTGTVSRLEVWSKSMTVGEGPTAFERTVFLRFGYVGSELVLVSVGILETN